MNFNESIEKRRTFGIISHPDAGKTTLTEKLLLFGGAIQSAGAVKNNKIKKTATSDFMEIEKLGAKVFEEYLIDTIKIFIDNNNEVLLIHPIPEFPYNIPDQYIYGNLELSEPALMNYEDYLERSDVVEINKIYFKLSSLSTGDIFPEKLLCDSYMEQYCVGAYDKNIFYYDNNHLTREGALIVGKEIINSLK